MRIQKASRVGSMRRLTRNHDASHLLLQCSGICSLGPLLISLPIVDHHRLREARTTQKVLGPSSVCIWSQADNLVDSTSSKYYSQNTRLRRPRWECDSMICSGSIQGNCRNLSAKKGIDMKQLSIEKALSKPASSYIARGCGSDPSVGTTGLLY